MKEERITSKNWSAVSSQIYNTNYNYNTKVLVVSFKNTGSYSYTDVPHEVWERLLKAISVGKFINNEIKNKYNYKKI